MVKYDDETLLNKGVAALGARRKLLKVFEIVKEHCETNVSRTKKHCCDKKYNNFILFFSEQTEH